MPIVTIKREKGNGYEPISVEVLLDGVPIASGGIGGEDEDNCVVRDYAWVLPAFEALAKQLGAEVVTEMTERDRP